MSKLSKYLGRVIVDLAIVVLFLPPAVYSRGMGNTYYRGRGNVQSAGVRFGRRGAQQSGSVRFGRRGAQQRFFNSLRLTGKQRRELREQSAKYREVIRKIREQLKAKRRELRNELGKNTVDEKKIYSIVSQINSLSAKQLELITKRVISTKRILTPEQFKKFQERARNIRRMMRRRFEKSRGETGNNFRKKADRAFKKGM